MSESLPERLAAHVARHPLRLLLTVTVLVVASWLLAGYSLALVLMQERDNNVAICRQINELERKLFIAVTDLGWPRELTERFLPTEDCEASLR